ncbi:hypothetical protein NDU88_003121 [Pleurodeles waltl]|uniref:Uncharacterized protein n=1 Tax=Pleurodeles waltl TaxID=8319 RepID=A0AAV7T571_PLEWA|nr:hypothetical protein NDU88_003121 [Pleurodeles waltl]
MNSKRTMGSASHKDSVTVLVDTELIGLTVCRNPRWRLSGQARVPARAPGYSNRAITDDFLWQDEEKAEAETIPSDTELDPYDDCLTNVPQDVIDLLMISDDEQEDFEGF